MKLRGSAEKGGRDISMKPTVDKEKAYIQTGSKLMPDALLLEEIKRYKQTCAATGRCRQRKKDCSTVQYDTWIAKQLNYEN